MENTKPYMRECSALLAGTCSNGFPVKRACILIYGIPPCMDEEASGRLYPITGSPLKEKSSLLGMQTRARKPPGLSSQERS